MDQGPLHLMVVGERDEVALLVGDSLCACGIDDARVEFKDEAWQALTAVGRGRFDALVVDTRRVEEDALKVARVAPAQGVDVPILLFVESADADYAARAVSAGAADCLTRAEVESAAFAHLMRALVERYRVAADARSDAAAYRRRIEEQSRDLEKAVEELRASQESSLRNERLTAIEQLVVTVRHEVNNPLAMLVGRSQLLRTRSGEVTDRVRSGLEEIESAALRIREIMDKLDLALDGRTTGYLGGQRIKLD